MSVKNPRYLSGPSLMHLNVDVYLILEWRIGVLLCFLCNIHGNTSTYVPDNPLIVWIWRHHWAANPFIIACAPYVTISIVVYIVRVSFQEMILSKHAVLASLIIRTVMVSPSSVMHIPNLTLHRTLHLVVWESNQKPLVHCFARLVERLLDCHATRSAHCMSSVYADWFLLAEWQ